MDAKARCERLNSPELPLDFAQRHLGHTLTAARCTLFHSHERTVNPERTGGAASEHQHVRGGSSRRGPRVGSTGA